jgi:glycosyltransferase involved in cell wall biosynthesis
VKVLLVTGSIPPQPCGVGDYAHRLATELDQLATDVSVKSDNSWSLTSAWKLRKDIIGFHPDIVHIQYPTVGYGWGLGPQAISLLLPTVVTLHEASQVHLLRQLSLAPFIVRSKHLIFTTPWERDYLTRLVPWRRANSSVIPIGSNIPAGHPSNSRSNRVVYFGLIRPKKGLEDFLSAAKLAQDSGLPLVFTIVGKVDPRFVGYFRHLKEQHEHVKVGWLLDLPEQEVAKILRSSLLGYLPFPDGASDRRGSLLAMLANGLATVTTQGKFTSDELMSAVQITHSPHEAVLQLKSLWKDPERRKDLSSKGVEHAQQFRWESVAHAHVKLYHQIVKDTQVR